MEQQQLQQFIHYYLYTQKLHIKFIKQNKNIIIQYIFNDCKSLKKIDKKKIIKNLEGKKMKNESAKNIIKNSYFRSYSWISFKFYN